MRHECICKQSDLCVTQLTFAEPELLQCSIALQQDGDLANNFNANRNGLIFIIINRRRQVDLCQGMVIAPCTDYHLICFKVMVCTIQVELL